MSAQAVIVAANDLVRRGDLAPLRVLDVVETRDGFDRDECALLIAAPDWLDGTQLNPIVQRDGYNRRVLDWGRVPP